MDKHCFICNKTKNIRIGFVGAYSLMKCTNCGLQFLDPIPDKNALYKIYFDYYRSWDLSRSEKEVSLMKSNTFLGYLHHIKPYCSSGTLLDVGCATGTLMRVAQKMGYDVYGVEISPEGIKRCREQFGYSKIVEGDLRTEDFPFEFFDVIILSDVLEHIIEPYLFLNILRNFLKSDGYLLIVTPNTSSWTRKTMGKRWLHYKEEHIYYYNISNIRKLLSSHFDICTVKSSSKNLTIDYVSSVLKAYSSSLIVKMVIRVLKKFPFCIRTLPLKINIGEMFILCTKKMVTIQRK